MASQEAANNLWPVEETPLKVETSHNDDADSFQKESMADLKISSMANNSPKIDVLRRMLSVDEKFDGHSPLLKKQTFKHSLNSPTGGKGLARLSKLQRARTLIQGSADGESNALDYFNDANSMRTATKG